MLALSTYLPLPDKLVFERSEANEDLPIFMAHGIEDPIVPLKLAQASCTRLLNSWAIPWSGMNTRCRTRCAPRELDHIGAFLREVLV